MSELHAETVCEHCMGRGRVPVEGWSFEHGSEPCPFCDPRHAHLDHVFNSPECWDKCGDPADWTEVEQLPEGEFVMMTDEFEARCAECNETAQWLVEIGFPFDFSTRPPPPPSLQRAVEDLWIEQDAHDGVTAEDIRLTVAEEGGWLHIDGSERGTDG